MHSLLRKGRWAFVLTAFFSPFVFPQERLQLCASCHGPDGNSQIQGTPSIAGQPRLFMENQLVLFREGIRKSPAMTPLMAGVSDKEIQQLAEHFSKQRVKVVSSGPSDAGLLKRGSELAKKLHCGVCHLSDFSGQKQMPRLAGQREEYLLSEMLAYRANQRPDTTMSAALYGASEADLRALAHFLSRQPSPSPARPSKSAP